MNYRNCVNVNQISVLTRIFIVNIIKSTKMHGRSEMRTVNFQFFMIGEYYEIFY